MKQIGDALVKLQHPYGGFLDGISMWCPRRQGCGCGGGGGEGEGGEVKVVGEVVTVKVCCGGFLFGFWGLGFWVGEGQKW